MLARFAHHRIEAPLGITAAKSFHQRATVRRAADEVTVATNRDQRVLVEQTEHRGGYALVARRADALAA